jgi:GNAT superfamily N-acetyltransferase
VLTLAAAVIVEENRYDEKRQPRPARQSSRSSPAVVQAAQLQFRSDPMDVRAAEERELDHLALVWYDGWQDAHAEIVPVELTRLRTLESFRQRLQAALPNIRVVGPPCSPVGFCIVKGAELYQLFVAAESRGSGVAAALVADAEARLAEIGIQTAWLACAIGNERAARFYEKCGWHRAGTMMNHLDTAKGTFLLEVWRYEKSLTPRA